MEHLYRDESLVGPGSYQPGWGPNDPSTDTGADRGPRRLRKKLQSNFTPSVEGVYSKASTSGYMSEACGWATGSPGGPPMRVRRAGARAFSASSFFFCVLPLIILACFCCKKKRATPQPPHPAAAVSMATLPVATSASSVVPVATPVATMPVATAVAVPVAATGGAVATATAVA